MLDICSLCLVTDIQLQTLEEPLSDFHDELCNYEFDGYALCCPKCEHLLRKFYNFRNKCIKANIVLKNWKKQSKLTKIPIRKLHEILPTSIGLSNVNNHEQIEADYTENNINIETFVHKTNVEKEVKDNQIEKCKVSEEVEATVKIELDDRKEIGTLDSLEIVAGELNKEQNNVYDDDVLNEDDINETDQDIDNDTINSEVNGGDFDVKKLLKEAINTDSSDDEVLQKKRKKVISFDETKDKMKKEVCKKRKSDDIGLDNSELSEDEPKQKKPRWKPVKHNLELTIEDVKRRLGNGDVRDKEGNVIDMDIIVNHLDKMSKHMFNKIKRYCAGEEPLSSEAIDFLGRTANRYGDQYASIFITKHLTTDEEIMEEFRKRETYQNYVESEHKCTRCFSHFKFAKMLKYHIAKYHDPNNAHKCKYCDVSFSRVERLWAHWNTHRVVYQCKLCPLVTGYQLSMKTHFNIHNGVKYPCTKCDSVLSTPSALAAHMNGVHQYDHICPCCARNFQTENGLHHHKLVKHLNEMNTEGPPSAKCELCNIQFISDEVYENHQRKRHYIPKEISAGVYMPKKRKPRSNTPIYTCRVCKHVEASMGALIWHFKSKHPNEEFDRKGIALRDPHKYLCQICGKGFHAMYALTEHKNVHTGTRPYSCPECPKAFHGKQQLKTHMKYHLPPTHQCPYCPKKFHQAANLINHKLTHTGKRRYACKICGKTFLYQGSLNEHVRGVHLHIRRTKTKLIKVRAGKSNMITE